MKVPVSDMCGANAMGCPPREQHLSAARAGGKLAAFLHRAGVRSTGSKGVGRDSGQSED